MSTRDSGGLPPENASYAAAGVDIDAGERAVELLAPHAKRATRPEVVGGIGGFAGLFALKGDYREPLLASSSDGVGTKLAVAQAMGRHDTVGRDLVAMVVDDLVVCGAEPLFLQDYIAIGKVVPEIVAEIVKGIADGCVDAGCALLGGETAEHPGLMADGHYDISATGVGVVEADEVLSADRVRAGDVVIAMASSGLHSNGYSLARKVLLEWGHMDLNGHVEELDRTLGEELLEPTRIYARDCLALIAEAENPFVISDDNKSDVALTEIAETIHDMPAILGRDKQPAGAAINVTVTLAREPDRGRINDGREALEVFKQDPIEQRLVAVH